MTSRRGFLGLLAGAGASLIAAPALALPGAVRSLSLHNINTGERFQGAYWADGRYLPDSLRRLNHFLRDHRAGAVATIDPTLFDQIFELQQRIGLHDPFDVVCAYRSPSTNAAKRRRGGGVARDSYHVRARAIDLRAHGYQVRGLYETALSMGRGGVAVYPRSDFVHLDTGPVRTWGAFAGASRGRRR